jgi:hypothetical protein
MALFVVLSACTDRANKADKESIVTASTPNTMPIACRPQALTKAEREHARALRTELAAATRRTTALANGYAFEYAADAILLQKAAEWISLERRCCPFLAFDLSWTQGEASLPRLAITGPHGTKDFMAAEMPELPRGM